MYSPISFKTDYSLLKSIIKIKDIINYAKKNNLKYVGILDDNPYAFMDFYDKCTSNNIKPILGMIVKIGDMKVYLYIKDYTGYKNIIKINNLKLDNKLNLNELFKLSDGLVCVLPYESLRLYDRFKMVFKTYLGYKLVGEYERERTITPNTILINEITYFRKEEESLLKVIYQISKEEYHKGLNYILNAKEEEALKIEDFVSDLNFKIEFGKRYIPVFCKTKEDSVKLLRGLAIKGLTKRLGGNVLDNYKKRLLYELSVIEKMGFVDYFLIVFDYVRYAKKNNIMVGPGRGSAAGSLVSYSLGITEIDPIKYNLLFERFLNPERVTMPDIDIDFEDIKRGEIINYVKNKYGKNRVSLIIAYGTLGSRQVLRDTGKVFNLDENIVGSLCKMIDQKKNLKDNLANKDIVDFVKANKLETFYKIGMRLEGLKKNTTIHAAGVVISSISLTELIPIYKNNENILAGYTAEYLEKLGLLKMDMLALGNLTIIHNIVDRIKKREPNFNILHIPLNDKKTFELFQKADTDSIFQFESAGMKNFLKKLHPTTFADLVAANALFRPGPMQNIDEYVARRNGLKPITYPDKSLEPILKDTYGIMIYQEEIMQVLSKMAGYSFAEADLIRRAMSKKKKDVMTNERSRFIEKSVERGYKESVASNVYDLILKFANYGFNKSHSVAYALIGYQMAYLKANYLEDFELNSLNMSFGSNAKIGDIIKTARARGVEIIKPDINISSPEYVIKNNKIILPLSAINSISSNVAKTIYENRPYEDYFDFFKKNYDKGINRNIIETLIKGGAFDYLGYSKNTLLANIDSAITYVKLCNDLDESLIMKPEISVSSEPDEDISELDIFGYYITGHPASKYRQKGMITIKDASKYVGKRVNMVCLVSKIKVITTKKGDEMAFVTLNDETGDMEAVIFPKSNNLIKVFKENDLVIINANIGIRNEKIQAIINDLKVIDTKKDSHKESATS